MPRRRHIGSPAWVLVLLALPACAGTPSDISLPAAEAPAGISFSTARTEYARGDTVRLLLVNDRGDRIGYNLCHATLEMLNGGEWLPVYRESGEYRFCTDEMGILAPGDSAVELQPLLGRFDRGVYRFRDEVTIGVYGSSSSARISSQGFRVR